MKKLWIIALLIGCSHQPTPQQNADLWLEDVEGTEALKWVNEQNNHTMTALAQSDEFKKTEEQVLQIMEAKDKIPAVSFMGPKMLVNFWRDDKNVRGILRTTTYESFKTKTPNWETILDFDEFAKKENANWVYKGVDCLPPEYNHCMMFLSNGGKDAITAREFSWKTKKFVDNGFQLPEAKSSLAWVDKDHLLVGTDFGGGSMTESGYPRILKLWKRGTPLAQAKTIFEGAMSDVWARPMHIHHGRRYLMMVSRGKDFFNFEEFVMDLKTQALKKIPKPLDASLEGYFNGHLLYTLRSPLNLGGKTYAPGDLISINEISAGRELTEKDVLKIFSPLANQSISSVTVTKNHVVFNLLDDVKGKLLSTTLINNQWQDPQMLPLPDKGDLSIMTSTDDAEILVFNYESFNQPSTLYGFEYGKRAEVLKTLPDRFDAKDVVVEQKFTTSADGTRVPYFLVYKKSVQMNGQAPTLLYGYGGFTVSLTPSYSGVVGKLWLEKGGVYVLANIRGGGEYGPKWHQAALKENRQKAYDDFIAVAEDLIKTKVTDSKHLAIRGGSNGGLLMGVMLTQRPDLFGAVLCWVPLLDMLRYSQLLAGASWMGEYGDPKVPRYRRALLKYSPYHNVKAGVNYPPTLIVTSTKDDRVHPGHARRMAAKLMALKQPVMYYENTEGGHAAGSNFKQQARLQALQQMFLEQTVMKK